MSKQYLKNVFNSIKECPAWSLQVLQYKYNVRNGLKYTARQIAIDPEVKLKESVERIACFYMDEGLNKYESVDDYTGDFVNKGIYKLNNLVENELAKLGSVIAAPDTEMPLKEFNANALLFKGTIYEELVAKSIVMVSMQKPFSFLTNKYRFENSNKKFHEIDDPVLTLRPKIDVLIVGNNVYLMGLAGEKLFHLDSTAKTICKTKTEDIAECGFFSDSADFISFAQHGHNPRQFLAYNEKHFEALKNVSVRKDMAEKFGFPLDENNNIKTDNAKAVGNLVKFLCNKGMTDPVDGKPMEVAAPKPWRK